MIKNSKFSWIICFINSIFHPYPRLPLWMKAPTPAKPVKLVTLQHGIVRRGHTASVGMEPLAAGPTGMGEVGTMVFEVLGGWPS